MQEYIQLLLQNLYDTYKPLTEGEVPTYIPQLALVDPDLFAISLVTVEGALYQVGDVDHAFTIQSMAKPFLHGLVLDVHGRDKVMKKIGVEPSGDPFNAIKLQPHSNRPYNPMVNAGAIAVVDMIPGSTIDDRVKNVQTILEAFAGKSLEFNPQVFNSEKIHGHHNRAMAYLMLNFGILDHDVEEVLDVYFKACSFLVKTPDIARMAAVLANGGADLVTHAPLLEAKHVKDLLSVMFTCGMYDFAGEWAYTVGFPGKSGVGGGIIGIVPHKLGIAVFSPRLDKNGNSLRGIKVCQDLSRHLNLSIF